MAKRAIATLDAETDPFKFGRVPKPFVWGFYDGNIYVHFWGNSLLDCTKMMLDYLASRKDPLTIYAHNGGKFDFLFFIEHLTGKIRIVNGRILEAQIGIHTLRDSYSILPIALSKLGAGKKEIDYALMEKEVREKNKAEILIYLEADCIALHKVVVAFLDQFGDILTVGSAAMREFKKFHKFETVSRAFDQFHRNYYFGGRCQCFETGVIDMPIKVFDINSAYPDAMDKIAHPIGNESEILTSITPNTFFVCWEGENFNAVPVREKAGLNFSRSEGIFWSTIHEFNAALDCNMIRPKKIKHTVNFQKFMVFSDFVQYFYQARKIAQASGNSFLEIFYKLILNSAYGKFAQDPEDYVDSIILPWGEIPGEEYHMEFRHDRYAIWSKPATSFARFNVATAASITGAVRATLLRGIANSTRPLYCDTDSIFCTDMTGVKDDKILGAWKEEKAGTQIAIAGKKLYALMDGDTCIKKASKGVNLNAEQIFIVARGGTVETRNDAPTFKLGGKVTYDKNGNETRSASFEHQFISRRIRRTALIKGEN
jgi:hypothetical protein